MIEEMYYMLVAFGFIFLFFVIYFSEVEYIKTDRWGREWNANIFISTPLIIVDIIIFIILAFQSWNIEVVDFTGGSLSFYRYDMDYMTYVFYVLVLVLIAILFKNVVLFFYDTVKKT